MNGTIIYLFPNKRHLVVDKYILHTQHNDNKKFATPSLISFTRPYIIMVQIYANQVIMSHYNEAISQKIIDLQ